MKIKQFMITGCGGTHLPAVIWQPEQDAKAVLQITHGMTEHMGRYEILAADLCRRGNKGGHDGIQTASPRK